MKEKLVGGNDANDDRQIATLNILSCPSHFQSVDYDK